MALTYDELKTQIDYPMFAKLAKGLNIKPSQMFVFEDIKTDREFASHFEEINKTVNELTDLKTKENDYKKKIEDYSRKEQMQTAKQRANAIITNKKLTDKPKAFIEKALEKEIEKLTDLSDGSLEKFVNEKFDSYKDFVSLTGEPSDIKIPSGDGVLNADPNDMTKKANNPLLAEDLKY